MIHECNVNCQSMTETQMELIGIRDTDGVWLSFILDLDWVEAAKVATLDEDSDCFECTSIYTKSGGLYIIDTKYKEFSKIFKEYKYGTRVQS